MVYDGFRAVRADPDRRLRRARPPVEPARPGRGRRASRARRPVCTSCCWSPRCCSAWPRCCATTAAQTIMPAIVEPDQLEKANGRMWSAEAIANTFIGPPLGSLLLIAAVSPAVLRRCRVSFFVAAALVCVDPRQLPRRTARRPRAGTLEVRTCRRLPLAVAHELLRPMAIILGLMNLASAISGAMLVLFAQEVLDIGPSSSPSWVSASRPVASSAGTLAPWLSKRLGSGTCLAMTLGIERGYGVRGRTVVVVAGRSAGIRQSERRWARPGT